MIHPALVHFATNESSLKFCAAAGAECNFGLSLHEHYTITDFHNFPHWFGWNFLKFIGKKQLHDSNRWICSLLKQTVRAANCSCCLLVSHVCHVAMSASGCKEPNLARKPSWFYSLLLNTRPEISKTAQSNSTLLSEASGCRKEAGNDGGAVQDVLRWGFMRPSLVTVHEVELVWSSELLMQHHLGASELFLRSHIQTWFSSLISYLCLCIVYNVSAQLLIKSIDFPLCP